MASGADAHAHARPQRSDAAESMGPPENADKDLAYLTSYMKRIRTDHAAPVETPAQLSTPQAERSVLDHVASEDDPKKRMEWQKMLRSVLESEVLSSETKRIAAADATTPTPTQLMHSVWLCVRALRVGHIHYRDEPESEEHLITEERDRLVPAVVADVLAFSKDTLPPSNDMRKQLFEAVQVLLERIEAVDELFPSQRQLLAGYPTWAQPHFQARLSALQAWFNVTRELRAQVQLLHRWTGTLTSSDGTLRPTMSPALPRVDTDEENTFVVERIFRESNIHEAFEQRTLKRLRMLIDMARTTLRQHHQMFLEMGLSSFEPDVLPLVRFPMWLAEGALRQRLEYADKLQEPSVLLVDSLADDLRAALALACRIKENYVQLTVPEPDIGWSLPLESDDKFDASICSALHFFFRLLYFRLKSTPYFKEVDVLEPEWDFLSSAVRVVPGGDVIVAHKTAALVNRVFARIIAYFKRELQVPTSSTAAPSATAAAAAKMPLRSQATSASASGSTAKNRTSAEPASAGRVAGGRVPMNVMEMTRWIHTVFNNTRVRSRRLIGFARRMRLTLETAAEYDLRTLKTAKTQPNDLHGFLQTMLYADYFLVYTSAFEERGVFVLAEPSLHDKPLVIQDLIFQCVRPSASGADDTLGTSGVSVSLGHGPTTHFSARPPWQPQYLLFLTPREPFLWTGRVMTLPLPWIDLDLKENRVRLVADGAGARLEQCKQHWMWQFSMHATEGSAVPSVVGSPGATSTAAAAAATAAAAHLHGGTKNVNGGSSSSVPGYAFSLMPVYERMAHLSLIQHELKLMTKAGYVLTDTVVHAVPIIRRQMLKLRPLAPHDRAACDELVQACFSIAFDQGARALGYIQSVRLHSLMSTALVQLSVDWISFICDDCVLTERRTFKWAVEALENAMTRTMGENIFLLSEHEFFQLRGKVSSCMALLISHFDILGARSSAVKEQEEKRAKRAAHGTHLDLALDSEKEAKHLSEQRLVALDACDAAREDVMRERREIGHVLDDTRMEDRGLQLLASKGVQMRWQQGRFIGGGTFGTVYQAVNLDTGGLMAVKEIRFQELTSSPNLFKQIHDEMNVMEMLRHPNIVEYYGIEVHREKVYIFEEYCQGGSLAQLLEHGRIEDEIVLQVYALQMLDGLMYLHSQGVVHRDIKPDNILLDHMGVIKFVDFGAAKVLSRRSLSMHTGGRAPVHLPGAVDARGQSLQGTPMYMAPEVVRGETHGREGAADIWSLGCVVLECAKGTRPWSQLDNEWAIMFHIGMAQQCPALPDETQLSALGIDFIKQCLTIDPFKRPTAVELRQHAWICALVDVLNAENEAEEEAQRAAEEEAAESAVAASESALASSTDPATDESEQPSYSGHAPDDQRLTHSMDASRDDPARLAPGAHVPLSTNSPGYPDHSHPGHEALVADVQYRREGAQIKAMLEPD